MFCGQCGTTNPDNGQFCVKCGATLSATQAGAPSGAGFVAPPAQPYMGPTKTSGKAIGSLICGLLFPAAIVAIILGHLSLSDIRKAAGRLTGRGIAIAGLVLGYLWIVFIPFMLIIAAIAIPNLLRARMAANQSSAAASLRTIDSAALQYSLDYGNGFPTSLEALGGQLGVRGDCTHAGLIDQQLASGRTNGYVFTYTPQFSVYKSQPALSPQAASIGCTGSGAQTYTLTADPIQPGSTGRDHFYTDQSGVIRIETDGPATADSPELK